MAIVDMVFVLAALGRLPGLFVMVLYVDWIDLESDYTVVLGMKRNCWIRRVENIRRYRCRIRIAVQVYRVHTYSSTCIGT